MLIFPLKVKKEVDQNLQFGLSKQSWINSNSAILPRIDARSGISTIRIDIYEVVKKKTPQK
jgi:hypothetical protein